jgi:hypothetical protein
MKSSLTITIADKIRDALQAEADRRGLGEDVPELLKNGFMLALQSQEGWVLKLQPAAPRPDPRQIELPLTSEP